MASAILSWGFSARFVLSLVTTGCSGRCGRPLIDLLGGWARVVRPGHDRLATKGGDDMDLDDVLPEADHVTSQSRWINASPDAVWDALHEIRLSCLPVTLVLGGLRFLPVLLTGGGRAHLQDRPFLDALPVPLLSSQRPESVVFGGALQAWRLTGGEESPSLDARGLREYDEPNWVKAAMDFRLTPRGNGTELSSETRVVSTDDATRRRFAFYWLFVQPGSTAIRWEVLTAVQLRAESRSH